VLAFSVAMSLPQRRWSWLVYLPVVFGMIHLAAGIGVWWELLRGPGNRPG